MKTADRDPPCLLVLKNDSHITGTFVVGDGVKITCHSAADKTITTAVLTLMGVYYVFDLDHPKIYSQLLGIFQTYLICGLPFDGKKSAKYRAFSNDLQKRLKSA